MDTIDAKIAAAEARTDTKFAQLMGELSTMRAEMNGKLSGISEHVVHVESSTRGTKTTIIITAIAALGLTVAVMAYGSTWFGLGMDALQISDRAVQSAVSEATRSILPRIHALEAQYTTSNDKLDEVLKALESSYKPLPAPTFQTPAPMEIPK